MLYTCLVLTFRSVLNFLFMSFNAVSPLPMCVLVAQTRTTSNGSIDKGIDWVNDRLSSNKLYSVFHTASAFHKYLIDDMKAFNDINS